MPAGTDTYKLTIHEPNHPPIANAGPDQTLSANANCKASATLDGTGSTDPDDDTLTYQWTGPNGYIANTAIARANGLALGTYVFTLTVNDGRGGTSSASVTITVDDTTPPTFTFVPPNMTVNTVTPVIQPATANDACSPPVTITNNAPASYPLGATVITWTARDLAGNNATATTTITVNLPPVANLTVLGKLDKIQLSWTPLPGIQSQNIYRGSVSGGPYVKIGQISLSTTVYVDAAGLISGNTYYYLIGEELANGTESSRSNEASVKLLGN